MWEHEALGSSWERAEDRQGASAPRRVVKAPGRAAEVSGETSPLRELPWPTLQPREQRPGGRRTRVPGGGGPGAAPSHRHVQWSHSATKWAQNSWRDFGQTRALMKRRLGEVQPTQGRPLELHRDVAQRSQPRLCRPRPSQATALQATFSPLPLLVPPRGSCTPRTFRNVWRTQGFSSTFPGHLSCCRLRSPARSVHRAYVSHDLFFGPAGHPQGSI